LPKSGNFFPSPDQGTAPLPPGRLLVKPFFTGPLHRRESPLEPAVRPPRVPAGGFKPGESGPVLLWPTSGQTRSPWPLSPRLPQEGSGTTLRLQGFSRSKVSDRNRSALVENQLAGPCASTRRKGEIPADPNETSGPNHRARCPGACQKVRWRMLSSCKELVIQRPGLPRGADRRLDAAPWPEIVRSLSSFSGSVRQRNLFERSRPPLPRYDLPRASRVTAHALTLYEQLARPLLHHDQGEGRPTALGCRGMTGKATAAKHIKHQRLSQHSW